MDLKSDVELIKNCPDGPPDDESLQAAFRVLESFRYFANFIYLRDLPRGYFVGSSGFGWEELFTLDDEDDDDFPTFERHFEIVIRDIQDGLLEELCDCIEHSIDPEDELVDRHRANLSTFRRELGV